MQNFKIMVRQNLFFVALASLLCLGYEGLSQNCPLSIRLVSDTVACHSEFPPPRGLATASNQFRVKLIILSGNPTIINWSNGDVGTT
ncbi:MAG TPA: hypothetical protein PLJ08_10355, partial [Cyclobacteriaceae bacterium]|nr:hypothetical protein [Cyclobacteriaceae bacterium]